MTNENVQSLCPVIPGKTNGSSWYQTTTSWWLNQPIWKMWVKLGIFPIWRVKIKNLWNHHQTNQMLSSESCIHPPPPFCASGSWKVWFFSNGFNNPVIDMKETWFLSMKNWCQISIYVLQSHHIQNQILLSCCCFLGGRRASILVNVAVCTVDGWNKRKNKKDSQRMHRKKRMHSRI